jgi:hypothetical protein
MMLYIIAMMLYIIVVMLYIIVMMLYIIVVMLYIIVMMLYIIVTLRWIIVLKIYYIKGDKRLDSSDWEVACPVRGGGNQQNKNILENFSNILY